MFTEILILVILALGLFLKLKWNRVRRFWADKGVQFSPPHPIFGSLTFLQKENPALWLRDLPRKFKGPYVGVWLFWRPALVIHCPEISRRVLVKDSDTFRNRYLGSGKRDPIGGLNIFTVDDPLWSNIRKRLTSVFTSAKLRSLEGLIKSKSQDLIARIRSEVKMNPTSTDVREMVTDYTTDIIGEASFGIKSEATRTGDSAIRSVTREFMKYNFVRGWAWSCVFFLPSLVDLFGFTMFPKHIVPLLRGIFRDVVKLRGGYDKPVKESRDLLDALLKMRQDAIKENEEISEDILVAQAAIFLQAGFEATGAGLIWTLSELAHRPDIQEKLYVALIEAQEKNGKELDSTGLADVPYLNAVIKETLRKYPPMGWLDRIASKDYAIDDKLTVSAGTVVYVNAVGIMRDPQNFHDPDGYDPERFLPENEKNIKPYTYMPFGEGPRNCIGMRFAYNSLRLAMMEIFLKFKVSPAEEAPLPNDTPIEKKAMLLLPSGQVCVKFTERN